MSWRHPDSVITDPKPLGVLVLSGLSRVWKNQTRDPILRDSNGNGIGGGGLLSLRLPFHCTPPAAAADVVIPDLTPNDLVVGTPDAKVLAKAEASKKRKASTFGLALSHVSKRNSDYEDDACVEIPLVTLIRSAVTIPIGENQSGDSVRTSTAAGPNTQDTSCKTQSKPLIAY
nr:hypothetical protein [Tanacetum cinerariifolium]